MGTSFYAFEHMKSVHMKNEFFTTVKIEVYCIDLLPIMQVCCFLHNCCSLKLKSGFLTTWLICRMHILRTKRAILQLLAVRESIAMSDEPCH